MITAQSRIPHRVDTSLHGGSDWAYLDDTPVPPPVVRCAPKAPRAWPARLWRWIRLQHARHELACLEDDHERYIVNGTAGPMFRANNAAQQRDLRSRIAMLECDLL